MPDETSSTATIEAPSPSAAPAAEAPAASAAPAAAPAAEIDAYDAAMPALLGTQPAEPKPEPTEPEEPEPTPTPAEPEGPFLTQAEQLTFKNANIDPASLAGWSRPQIDAFAGAIRQQQAQTDALNAELSRFKADPGTQPQPEKPAAPLAPMHQRISDAVKKLDEVFEGDFKPVGEILTEMETANESARQQAAMVPAVADLVTEMILDSVLDGLATDYPSITAPESRQKVVDRFWTEWSTGSYMKPGGSIKAGLRDAMLNAAKVTFLNTNEQSAAANLVKTNKAKVAGQPKAGGSAPRSKPATMDDLYDRAFQETIGKELAGR